MPITPRMARVSEPEQDDGTEDQAHPRRPPALEEEQEHEDHDRRRHHVVLKPRCRDLEPFYRAQHRDRRRDHAVSVEERGAEEAEADEEQGPAAHLARGERHEGQDSSLAVVVRAQDVDVVLERDDDHQRPDDERQDAEHVGMRRPAPRAGRRSIRGRA